MDDIKAIDIKLDTGTFNRINAILDNGEESLLTPEVPTECVHIKRLDEFCQQEQIKRVSYLKVDTEGQDLEVLKGTEQMLRAQLIDIVEVEAGMNVKNTRHIHFDVFKNFLENHNYFLFGLYEQVREAPSREPHLRRSNCVFISQNMVDANRN